MSDMEKVLHYIYSKEKVPQTEIKEEFGDDIFLELLDSDRAFMNMDWEFELTKEGMTKIFSEESGGDE